MPISKKVKKTIKRPRIRPIPRVLLLVETSRAYGRRIVEGVARYAFEHGPWSIHFEERGFESCPPIWLKEWDGDGIIVRSTNMKLAQVVKATKLPFVELYGNTRVGEAQVRMDSELGTHLILDHFVSHGLRHFAYFTYGQNWWTQIQSDFFCRAVQERGSECHVYKSPVAFRTLPVWHESYRPNVVEWLRSLPRPVGIYAAADLHAIRLLDVCRENNIAVPEEVAIVGVGNDPVLCETVRPTLSSLDLDARRIGYEAARLLAEKMAGKDTREIVEIPPSRVVIRQSTDHMAISDPDVVQAMHFIRDYACSGINVYRVAEEVGLSRRGLERRFQQYVGTTPKAEITRVRIEHAKSLLAYTDQLSERISRKIGFASLAYFTTAFRREVGMTPNAYRRMRRVSRDLRTD
jgi:LacI family transcriptional regulator